MVIEFDGVPCQGVCTGRGHLEGLASGSAATLKAQEAFGPAVGCPPLVRLANDGDPTRSRSSTRSGASSAPAIGTLVNIFNPELVVIGGGFGAAAKDYLLPPAREIVVREALEPGRHTRAHRPGRARLERRPDRRRVRGVRSARFVVPLAVCATPIGNLDDVTLRLLEELAAADVVLCEDTRHTRVLLERHGIEARLLSYHEHNEAARTAELLPRLRAGERIALVSDAGLPGINDPGCADRRRGARCAGCAVTVLPGPSAVETALVASGLVGERYQFLGYLPRAEKALADALGGARLVAASGGRVRVAEAAAEEPRKPRASPARAAGRRLPRADESASRRSSAAAPSRSPRGSARRRRARSRSSSAAACRQARRTGKPARAVSELVAAGVPRRQAADLVARLTGRPRNRLYRDSL